MQNTQASQISALRIQRLRYNGFNVMFEYQHILCNPFVALVASVSQMSKYHRVPEANCAFTPWASVT